jgi:hypothetical protein
MINRIEFHRTRSFPEAAALIVSIYSTGLYRVCSASIVVSDHGRHSGVVQIPSFVQEPPSHVTFSNNTGAHITCTAHANPIPLITWLTKDGSIVNTVPGLRFVRCYDPTTTVLT